MSALDDFLAESLVKTAAAAPTPPPPPPVTPAPTPNSIPQGLGIDVPWKGALIGGVGAGVYDYLFGDDDQEKNLGRFLRRGLTGAAVGAGAQLGIQGGGELARRHAVHGGGNTAVGMTPVAAAAGLGGLGYYLTREKDEEKG